MPVTGNRVGLRVELISQRYMRNYLCRPCRAGVWWGIQGHEAQAILLTSATVEGAEFLLGKNQGQREDGASTEGSRVWNVGLECEEQ